MATRPAFRSPEHERRHRADRLPPTAATDEPAGDGQRGRGFLATLAVVVILLLAALAIVRPSLLPGVVPFVVAAALAAGWWRFAIRAERRRPSARRLEVDNGRLRAELERLSDQAWELRESEERYRSLIDAQGDLVVRRDHAGRVTFLNPAFAAAFGLDPVEAIGAPLAVGPVRDAGIGADAAEDVRLDTTAGARWFAWLDVPVRDEDGRFGAWYSVARDITARKQSERALDDARRRAEAANQAKSRLLATVSHEFRTPLNGILGLAGLLRETGLTSEQETYARGVQSSGEALLALVDDMLDFSRIEAGRLDLHAEPTTLEPLIQDIVELLAARAHPKGIDIAADVEPDLPDVLVDPVRLRQVLINLAGNGVKFTETGGVTVSAEREPGAGDGIRVRFAVADTGPGVAPDAAERLFEEFEQNESAPGRRHGGAGLGLAISRRIVRHMGGDLVLDRHDGPGARFAFALTLPTVAAATADAPKAVPRLDGRNVLILAADGTEPVAAARNLARAGAGARVVHDVPAAGGLVAAAVAAGQPYDAVLIDHRLLKGGGGALADLRAAAGSRLPAAVLIAPGARGDIERLREEGFDAYLVRPVRRVSLARVIADIVEPNGGFRGDPGDEVRRQARPSPVAPEQLDVLLAEDNEINALLARAVLERLGHRVTEVRDGAAAVAAVAARARPFGAILMDIHMPGLDGLTAVRDIRALENRRGEAPVPILALTADVLQETRESAENAGVTAVVPKPVTPEALRGALVSAIAG